LFSFSATESADHSGNRTATITGESGHEDVGVDAWQDRATAHQVPRVKSASFKKFLDLRRMDVGAMNSWVRALTASPAPHRWLGSRFDDEMPPETVLQVKREMFV
jgi:hypothetical protein